MQTGYKKIVIKVGSNVIAGENNLPDETVMDELIRQMAQAKKNGTEVILVSSGAVASGRSLWQVSEKADPIARRQLLASIGQVKLINTYTRLLQPHGLICAQILVTKEDFRDRMHYLNMKRCLGTLLQNNIIPIINENDVISVTELMFTDNDELAGLISSMLGADALLILTNVDGIYDRPPKEPGASVIPVMDGTRTDFSNFISTEKSNFGRGGMITKCSIAQKLALVGIKVHIANGKTPGIISAILQNQPIGTLFVPKANQSKLKRWVANSEGYAKGYVVINEGAKNILSTSGKAISLLPVGITKIEGSFQKGDIIKITAENGQTIGVGMAQYSSIIAQTYLGEKNKKPLIHYDYLFLYD
ncbi:glutamate 5-kinase [Rhodocytophaga rosea]|uniref:Glutamate 5-kinase n=1 Tax=Rhodocytophaga rosea TaxID=2704465 RepID=A0A6C0GFH1_9BACT|nr:glutamate 5-kinase [Rhodocytophaga rosea]QHT66718.1 glutamate 5-kinase [Rhodocytophaga rosea]